MIWENEKNGKLAERYAASVCKTEGPRGDHMREMMAHAFYSGMMEGQTPGITARVCPEIAVRVEVEA